MIFMFSLDKWIMQQKYGRMNSSYSLLSADPVQRDLTKLGLKDANYNVHRPPDFGGHGQQLQPAE